MTNRFNEQNAFRMDPNFEVGLLLFRHVLAAQTGRAPVTAGDPTLVGVRFAAENGWTAPGDVVMSSFSNWGPTDDGRIKEARGVARVRDPDTNSRLEVSFVSLFGWRLFWGDYWIIDLDSAYQWAVVGHPNRSYLWILSRQDTLDEEVLSGIKIRLQQQGYDLLELLMSPL